MPEIRPWAILAVIAFVTAVLRFLPFVLFSRRKVPRFIEDLGRVLPCAIMGMLVVYCLKGVSFSALSGFMPELISCAAIVVLHVWKRNTLLSILGGTVCYMLLIRFIF